jgi:indole-3-glycerol phosphate synthase
MKEVSELLRSIEEGRGAHFVTRYMSSGHFMDGLGRPVSNMYDCLYSRPGTHKVLAEYNTKAKTGFVMGIPPPEVLGGLFRECAQAVVVSTDRRSGGASEDEFIRFARDSHRFRKSTPGPVPLILHDYIIDAVQVQRAAALGAAGVAVSAEITGKDMTRVIAEAHRLGEKTIVHICTWIYYISACTS